jgi:hypothetical protein
MSTRRTIGGLLSILLVAGLAGCTPAVAEFWRVSDDGEVSFASCDQFTIDSITVTTRAKNDDGSYVIFEEFELSGPDTFFAKGQSFDLASVADGWNALDKLDMSVDWQELTLEGSKNEIYEFFGSVNRADLPTDGWIQRPPPGIGVEDCDLLP